MGAIKSSYTGKFNISREVMTETADAYSAEQTKFFMSQKIALKAGVMPHVVWEYLKTHPHSYEIREIPTS